MGVEVRRGTTRLLTSHFLTASVRLARMDFLNVGGWDLFAAALVSVTALAALAGIGVALILRNRGPIA